MIQKNLPPVYDSLPVTVTPDSVSKKTLRDSGWVMKTGISFSSVEFNWQVLQHHPYFGFQKESTSPEISERKQFNGKEWLFYLLIFLLVVFALIRRTFPKYFNNLFRLFFRTTLKQRQIREQLMQTPLPSLLLNGFFVVTGGLYITFLLQHFKLDPVHNFWLLFLYSSLGLSAAYFIKFIGLKVSGWLFNFPEAAESYTFIVFIVNKMIGILLLPFLVLLAFCLGDVYSVGLTLSGCLVAGLLVYRFILTFTAIRNQVKVNPFHFILYLCAFEIAPLLLVYKVLFQFFNQTT
ncbi:MAG: DUF4271 domain-containing protein [Chitinophagaceae bacterium]|nr:DUF4271 domain-containing protein [Chitinophagaceae bacterium]